MMGVQTTFAFLPPLPDVRLELGRLRGTMRQVHGTCDLIKKSRRRRERTAGREAVQFLRTVQPTHQIHSAGARLERDYIHPS